MKKSEFKKLVHEAVLEMLPELIEIIRENTINESYTPPTSVQQKPDLTLVRQSAERRAGYDDKDFPNAGPTYRAIQNAPAPPNPKAVIDGETFASGKGIMEWFSAQGGPTTPTTEFKHSEQDMKDFMAKKFGVK